MEMFRSYIVAAVIVAGGGLVRAEVKVQEQVMGPAVTTPDGWGAVGRHGSHVAIIAPKGSRMEVIVDGVEGPKFDRIVLTNHFHSENNAGAPGTEDQHILFSPDGSRVAYVGLDGADNVVMVDGKEMGRSKEAISMMGFSPGGKHLYYAISSGPTPGLFVDGHGGPPPATGPIPAFSGDDVHYLYPVVNAATHQMNPYMDGKAAGYAGQGFVFTGDGQDVLGIASDKTGDTLLLDGGAVTKAAGATLELFAAPRGSRYAYVEHRDAGDSVMVDGKKIDGVDAKKNQVIFSPDATHVAIMCGDTGGTGGHGWVIVDGKKQQNYEQVADGHFSADSSAFIYTAMNNYKFFVVVNGSEWDGHAKIDQLTTDATGVHIAFVDGTNVILDNKAITPRPSGDIITGTPVLSADGRHLAFVHDSSKKLIDLDGEDFKGITFVPFTQAFRPNSLIFSPDGKHLLSAASTSGAGGKAVKGVAIDGQVVPATDNVTRAVFTPDSRHVFWQSNEMDQRNSGHKAVFLDGKQVATFETSPFDGLPGAWDMSSDGTLSVIGLSGDSIKRFAITPSDDTTIATMLATAAADAAAVPAPPARGARGARGATAPPARGARAGRGNN